MFFLGAGFMLVETKAVVHMALLFGSTWMVNSVVFFAVLVMILPANLFVLAVRPQRLWPYYAGLLRRWRLNAIVPLDFFLGMTGPCRWCGSCLLVFAPILFAGVIFAVSFGRTERRIGPSAPTSPAPCSAAWRNTPRCCWVSSTWCWWPWPCMPSPQ